MTDIDLLDSFGPWVQRPLQGISPEILPFWEHLSAHSFRLPCCKRCGTHYWPYTVCVRHADIPSFEEMAWDQVTGLGRIFATVIVERVQDPEYADEVPYLLALIRLDEGPLFPGRIVNCDPYEMAIGDHVGVVFVDVPTANYTLPFFEPRPDHDSRGSA